MADEMEYGITPDEGEITSKNLVDPNLMATPMRATVIPKTKDWRDSHVPDMPVYKEIPEAVKRKKSLKEEREAAFKWIEKARMDAADAKARAENAALQSRLAYMRRIDPDEQKEAEGYAKKYGVSVDEARNNMDAMRGRDIANKANDLQDTSPVTAKAVTDGRLNSLPTVKEAEATEAKINAISMGIFNAQRAAISGFIGDFGGSIFKGLEQLTIGRSHYGRMMELQAMTGGDEVRESGFLSAKDMEPISGMSSGIKSVAKRIDAEEEFYRDHPIFGGAMRGLGQVGGQMMAHVMTLGYGSLPILFLQGAGQMQETIEENRERLIKQGKDPSIAGEQAAFFGGAGVTAITEKFGLDLLFGKYTPAMLKVIEKMGSKRLIKLSERSGFRYLLGSTAAGLSEGTQEVTEDIGQSALMVAFNDGELPDPESLLHEFLVGAIVGFVAHSGVALRGYIKSREAARGAAELGKQAHESKMDAETRGEVAQEAGKNAGYETVYIDREAWNTYYQSQNMDPKEAAERYGITNYNETAESGAYLEMPVGRWAGDFASTDGVLKLGGDVTMSPDTMTDNQRIQTAVYTNKKLAEAFAKLGKDVGHNNLVQNEINAHIEAVTNELLKQEGQTSEIAKASATIFVNGHLIPVINDIAAKAQEEGREVTPEEVAAKIKAWDRPEIIVMSDPSAPPPSAPASEAPTGDVADTPMAPNVKPAETERPEEQEQPEQGEPEEQIQPPSESQEEEATGEPEENQEEELPPEEPAVEETPAETPAVEERQEEGEEVQQEESEEGDETAPAPEENEENPAGEESPEEAKPAEENPVEEEQKTKELSPEESAELDAELERFAEEVYDASEGYLDSIYSLLEKGRALYERLSHAGKDISQVVKLLRHLDAIIRYDRVGMLEWDMEKYERRIDSVSQSESAGLLSEAKSVYKARSRLAVKLIKQDLRLSTNKRSLDVVLGELEMQNPTEKERERISINLEESGVLEASYLLARAKAFDAEIRRREKAEKLKKKLEKLAEQEAKKQEEKQEEKQEGEQGEEQQGEQEDLTPEELTEEEVEEAINNVLEKDNEEENREKQSEEEESHGETTDRRGEESQTAEETERVEETEEEEAEETGDAEEEETRVPAEEKQNAQSVDEALANDEGGFAEEDISSALKELRKSEKKRKLPKDALLKEIHKTAYEILDAYKKIAFSSLPNKPEVRALIAKISGVDALKDNTEQVIAVEKLIGGKIEGFPYEATERLKELVKEAKEKGVNEAPPANKPLMGAPAGNVDTIIRIFKNIKIDGESMYTDEDLKGLKDAKTLDELRKAVEALPEPWGLEEETRAAKETANKIIDVRAKAAGEEPLRLYQGSLDTGKNKGKFPEWMTEEEKKKYANLTRQEIKLINKGDSEQEILDKLVNNRKSKSKIQPAKSKQSDTLKKDGEKELERIEERAKEAGITKPPKGSKLTLGEYLRLHLPWFPDWFGDKVTLDDRLLEETEDIDAKKEINQRLAQMSEKSVSERISILDDFPNHIIRLNGDATSALVVRKKSSNVNMAIDPLRDPALKLTKEEKEDYKKIKRGETNVASLVKSDNRPGPPRNIIKTWKRSVLLRHLARDLEAENIHVSVRTASGESFYLNGHNRSIRLSDHGQKENIVVDKNIDLQGFSNYRQLLESVKRALLLPSHFGYNEDQGFSRKRMDNDNAKSVAVRTYRDESGKLHTEPMVFVKLKNGSFSNDLNHEDRVDDERYFLRATNPENLMITDGISTPDIKRERIRDKSKRGRIIFRTLKNGEEAYVYTVKEAGLGQAKFTSSTAFLGDSSYYQDKKNPRGMTESSPDGSVIRIHLFKNADVSTFIHETGHSMLISFQNLAMSPDAAKATKEMFARICEFLGAKPDENGEIHFTVEQHEKFARAMEAYVMEGKAPTNSLKGVFRRFKAWMTSIYKTLTALNVELSPDIRDVFDRMIATDAEIEVAKAMSEFGSLFTTAEEMGISQEVFDAYKALAEGCVQSAHEKILARKMAYIKKKKTKEYNEILESVKKQLKKAYQKLPAVIALNTMKSGDIKLSRSALVFWNNGDESILDAFPKEAVAENGLTPDEMAPLFGYETGEQLINAIRTMPTEDAYIQQNSDRAMRERFDEMLTDDELREEALAALTNEDLQEMKLMELRALEKMHDAVKKGIKAEEKAKKQIIDKEGLAMIRKALALSKEIVKEKAQGILAEKEISKINPDTYMQSAKTNAVNAEKAKQRGDYAKAAGYKAQEILCTELYRQAVQAKKDIRRALKLFQKIRNAKRKNYTKYRDVNIVYRIRYLLGQYGVGQHPGYWMEKLETAKKNGEDADTSAVPFVNYRNMTLSGFMQMVDEIKGMWENSERRKTILVGGKKLQLDEVAKGIVGELEKAGISNAPERRRSGILSVLDSWATAMKRVELQLAMISGENGLLMRAVFYPIHEACVKARLKQRDVMTKLNKVVSKLKFVNKKIEARELIDADGKAYVFNGASEVFGALLHTGNESNLSKLLVGYGWGKVREDGTVDTSNWDRFILRMVKEGVITKAHYDAAQAIWDVYEELKPLAQKANKEVFGVYFKEVKYSGINTPFGRMKGGYVPAKVSDEARVNPDEIADIESKNVSAILPVHEPGFTKARRDSAFNPLVLDGSRLINDTIRVINFAYIAPAYANVRKLLNHPDVTNALARYDADFKSKVLAPWMNRARVQSSTSDVDTPLGRWLASIRSRAGMSLMFANIRNTIQQLADIIVGASYVRPSNLLSAIRNKDRKVVMEKSEYMRDRMGMSQRAMLDNLDSILLGESSLSKADRWLQRHAYFMQQATDDYMSTILWTAAYNDMIQDGKTEKEAVRHADSIVRKVMMSQNPEDVSSIEAGSALKRLFTQFSGFFVTRSNLMFTRLGELAREAGAKASDSNTTKAMKILRDRKFKALMILLSHFAVPAIVDSAIAIGLRGGDNKWPEEMLAGVLSYAAGLTGPFLGQALSFVAHYTARGKINAYNTRLISAPALSILEDACRLVLQMDNFTADKLLRAAAGFSILASPTIPLTLARDAQYVMKVGRGEIYPSGPFDFARGAVTGK